MIMKKIFSAILILTGLVFNASAQDEYDTENFSAMKSDYKKVRAVAHVKVKSVEPVEDRGYITYAADGEIVESFKGEFKPRQPLKFYFIAEPGHDIKKWYPKERIVFLEGKHPIKSASGETGWFELENSHREPDKENISIMRRIKSGRKRINKKRRQTIRRTGKRTASALENGFNFQKSNAFCRINPGIGGAVAL